MVPLRATFEALGSEVDWENDTQTVTAVKDGYTVRILRKIKISAPSLTL